MLLKAAAGGGGKGMRLVDAPDELEAAYGAARAEAEAAFGDGSLYVEKALVARAARRDPGALRRARRRAHARRARVLDPAPPPEADRGVAVAGARRRSTREAMEAAAERACRALGYVNAGTFEFLLGPDGRFYFIELNCRLQVEHPVTRAVTGHRHRPRAAADRGGRAAAADRARAAPRPRDRDPDQRRGSRRATSLPAPGTIDALPAAARPGRARRHRVVEDGAAIPPYYDSLIAKVIVWDDDRDAAIARAIRALEELEVEGIPTTRDARARHPALATSSGSGDYSTSYLAEMEGRACRRCARVSRDASS